MKAACIELQLNTTQTEYGAKIGWMKFWRPGRKACKQIRSLQQLRWNATQRQNAEVEIAGVERRLAVVIAARKKRENNVGATFGGVIIVTLRPLICPPDYPKNQAARGVSDSCEKDYITILP